MNLTDRDQSSGSLPRNSHKIVLHTNLGNKLWTQPWSQEKIGFVQFATILNTMTKAARKDDPYAEWYLCKIYQELRKAIDNVKAMKDYANELIQTEIKAGIEIVLWENATPYRYNLAFANQLAVIGARVLLTNIDMVMRQLLTLKNLYVDYDHQRLSFGRISEVPTILFSFAKKWKKFDITREDEKLNTSKALSAKEYFGNLPKEILNKSISFDFLPSSQES